GRAGRDQAPADGIHPSHPGARGVSRSPRKGRRVSAAAVIVPAGPGRACVSLRPMDILTETQNLWQRFQRGGGFRGYVRERLIIVVPALVIFLAYSVATTAGTVITLGGTRSFLVLVGLITAPFILIGSLYFLILVFFLWLENRAIAHATHHIPPTAKQDVLA